VGGQGIVEGGVGAAVGVVEEAVDDAVVVGVVPTIWLEALMPFAKVPRVAAGSSRVV